MRISDWSSDVCSSDLSGRATDAEDSTMTDIKRIVPGKRMSQAVACGNLVFLAGQVAQRAGGAAVAEQTKDILARIEELLAEAGSDKTKLLSATIWLTDIATFDEMNGFLDAWWAPGAAPARA